MEGGAGTESTETKRRGERRGRVEERGEITEVSARPPTDTERPHTGSERPPTDTEGPPTCS